MGFPRQEYWSREAGYHFLLEGISLTQDSNAHLLCFLHWQADSSPLSHLGSPYICIYFFRFISIIGYYKIYWVWFPVLYSRSLLVIYFIFFQFYFFLLLYNIALVFHTLTWVCHGCTCVPHPEPLLPPPFSSHPSGSSQCTSPEHPVSCIEPGLVICFTYDNIHVSIPFSHIILPSPFPTESK